MGTFLMPGEGQCMAEMTLAERAAYGVEWPPTEDGLPYDDGMPSDSMAAQDRGAK